VYINMTANNSIAYAWWQKPASGALAIMQFADGSAVSVVPGRGPYSVNAGGCQALAAAMVGQGVAGASVASARCRDRAGCGAVRWRRWPSRSRRSIPVSFETEWNWAKSMLTMQQALVARRTISNRPTSGHIEG
jgi:hypothetical protein